MFSKRGLEYLAGALLIVFVATIVVTIATNPISAETFREDARGVLVDIAQDRELFIVSTAFDLAASLITILFAAALYVVFRSHDRALALLGSFGFLASAVLFLTGDMVAIALTSLAQDFAAATGDQRDVVLASARPIGLMRDAAFAMGAVGVAIGVLSYGLLYLKTNALPRWMGPFGVIGGIVTPFGWLLFVNSDLVAILFIGLMIALFFALISGLYLVFKGAREAD